MTGIVLISHGKLAEGMLDAARMFFDELKQVQSVSLLPGETPDAFQHRMEAALEEVDTGDGVIVLADMLGGMPSNRAASLLYRNIEVICGINLPLLLEVLSIRNDDGKYIDTDQLVKYAQQSVKKLSRLSVAY
ncbi:PTS sugar transporter subunit IIA [Eubacteriales bacterium OttesenSCG-928-N14]|nr:PTS sugar transporter subunit IIA [Eubacteriales bacterium OttesenSCG-928-N14]